MSLLLRLFLGHMLGDYVFQPLRLVLMKRRGWPGVLLHVTVVVSVTALLLWPVLNHWWYWLWLVFLAISHSVIDASRALYWSESDRHALLYLTLDQGLHVGVMAAIAGVTRAAVVRHLSLPTLTTTPQGDALTLYLIVFIFLLWSVPVLELETVNALHGGERQVGVAARDRWLGALERVGGLALMLSGFLYLAPLAFVPRIVVQSEEWRASPLGHSFFAKTAISFCSAAVCAAVLMRLPFPFG
jgi:hypothetical protein